MKPEWIKLYISRIKGVSWGLPDFQWAWYWKLLFECADNSDKPGYLPNDESILWRLAGAKTRWFFEKNGGREVLQRFFRSTDDGLWIYNPTMLDVVLDSIGKLKKTKDASKLTQSSVSLSKEVVFDLKDPKDIREEVEEVFKYYMQKFNRDSRYKLTPARRKKAEMRLLELLPDCGRSVDVAGQVMREAIDHLAASEFHVNGGYYDWDDHLFHSREMLQKRLAMKVLSDGWTKDGKCTKHPDSGLTHTGKCWECVHGSSDSGIESAGV